MRESKPMFDLKEVKMHYPITSGLLKRVQGHVKAVDGVSLQVFPGETVGIVGESGCGKTTLGKTMVMLEKPTAGEVGFNISGQMRNINHLNKDELFQFRKHAQMVFQDPYSSLNPQKTIRQAFDEPLTVHGFSDSNERIEIMEHLMNVVNLRSEHLERYPHEFSGGQRQRICIARALCINPRVLVCDEPVSALDVSIQAQVLNLLKDIQEDMKLTYVFIAHDLSVVQFMSDRIAVMYLGKIVELADSDLLYSTPLHPYTQALLSAIPVPSLKQRKERIVLEGDMPSPINKLTGCSFHTRCLYAMDVCRSEEPSLRESGGHWVACHLHD